MSGKLKILCLHGYRQNEKTFYEKTGGLRKALKSSTELDFLRAPHAVPDQEDGQLSWFFSHPSHSLLTYISKESSSEDPGFKESVQFVLNHVKENGPYDGIMAFSQGACFASMLSTMPELKYLKFVVLFSGFKSRIEQHQVYYDQLIDVPSLHVFGETDEVISTDRCQALADSFTNAECLVHKGGHFVPTSAPVRNRVKEFLLKFKV